MTARHLALTALLAGGLLAGCGSSDKPAPAGPQDALALCESIGQALTDKAAACGAGLPVAYLDLLLGMQLDCRSFGEAQAAGRIAFDQAKAKACVDALGTGTCSALFASGDLLPGACREAVAPRVAPGGLCHSRLNIECTGGFCDLSTTAACISGGTCVAYATAGQSCAAPIQCGPGLQCNASRLCVPRPATVIQPIGGNCEIPSTTCGDGLYCNTATTPDTCAPRLAAGIDCTSEPCAAGLFCEPLSSMCRAQPKLGEACVQGQMACAGMSYCGPANTCVAQPALGADCVPLSGGGGELVFCQDSWCPPPVAPATTTKCATYTAPGAACDTRNLLQCGLGHACVPVTAGSTTGVCGRVYCGSI